MPGEPLETGPAGPDHAAAGKVADALARARQCRTDGERGDAIARLEALLSEHQPPNERRELHFTLASLHDAAGNYGKAFSHASSGHALKPPGDYAAERYGQYVDAMIAAFSAERIAHLPRSTQGSRRPIFIVGMPRSGTTLVEQILSSHPQVHGAGELREIMNIADALPARIGGGCYPLCVPALTRQAVDAAAARYLASIEHLAPEHVRVTDKMPHNFQHLGLIHLLFPQAPVVHCLRDARDTCLSCYLHDFAGYHPYTRELALLGTHYRNYARLMSHWRAIGLPILDIAYERLVTEPEPVVRELLTHCGLAWDDACLRFHENRRTVHTASRDQVRRPLYTSAIGRWQHYETWLAPLTEALGESMTARGAPDSRQAVAEKQRIAALAQSGAFTEARTLGRAYCARAPRDPEGWFLLGAVHGALNEYEQSIECCRKAIGLAPQAAPAHLNLGIALGKLGRPDEAVASLAEAVRLAPDNAQAHAELGKLLMELGEHTSAETHLRAGLARHPNFVEAHFYLGNLLRKTGREGEALPHYREACRLRPGEAPLLNNLGITLLELGEVAQAERVLEQAAQLAPANPDACINLARLCKAERRMDEALDWIGRALARAPESARIHGDRALLLLQSGDFAQGWREYRHRWHGEGMIRRHIALPEWQGEDVSGKTVLILAEQGIGDELMFASCYPDMVRLAGKVIIDCAPRLAPILARSFPTALIHGGEQTADPAWIGDHPVDYQIAAGDLPRHFRNAKTDFPGHTGYLLPDPAQVSAWRSRLDGLGAGIRVGISWRGGHLRETRITRSTRLPDWRGILGTKGACFVNLQYGDCRNDLSEIQEQYGITVHDWPDSDPLHDLDGFAAKIAALDLVISVDNSTVHLAGALGRPVWVLQPYSADWRWGVAQAGSLWYPSLKNFHQPNPADWKTVLETVQADLARLIP